MKRYLKRIVLILAIIMMLTTLNNFGFISIVSKANSDPDLWGNAYNNSVNPFSQSGYYGQCTWYAWGRAYEVTGEKLPCRGAATNWWNEAVNAGWTTSSTPRKNSVICWSRGHVAFVEEYDGNNITISQANTANIWDWMSYEEGIANYDGKKTMSMSELGYYLGTIQGYIYVGKVEEKFVPEGSKQDLGFGFVAQIVPKTSKNLAVESIGTKNGANVYLNTRDKESNAQKWIFSRNSDNSYKVTNILTGLHLDVYGGGNNNYENIQTWGGGKGDKQSWFIYSYNGAYRMVPRSSSDAIMTMDIKDGKIKSGANIQLYETYNNTNNAQTFLIESNTYKFNGKIQDIGTNFTAQIVISCNTNLAVETKGTQNSSNVYIKTKNKTSDSQKWKFVRNTDGSYRITNVLTGLNLDIYGTGNSNGENIQTWGGGKGDKQNWFIYSYNDGYAFVPRSSATDLRVIDVQGSVESGSNLQLWETISDTSRDKTFKLEREFLIGDANGDGKVNFTDYLKILSHVKKTKLLTGEELKRADVNNDGKVNFTDYLKVLSHVKKTTLLW